MYCLMWWDLFHFWGVFNSKISIFLVEKETRLIQYWVDVSVSSFCPQSAYGWMSDVTLQLYVVVMTLPSVDRFSRRAFATAYRSTALTTLQRCFIWTTWSSERTLEYMSRYRRLIADAGQIVCEPELLKACRVPWRRRSVKCNRGHTR